MAEANYSNTLVFLGEMTGLVVWCQLLDLMLGTG